MEKNVRNLNFSNSKVPYALNLDAINIFKSDEYNYV